MTKREYVQEVAKQVLLQAQNRSPDQAVTFAAMLVEELEKVSCGFDPEPLASVLPEHSKAFALLRAIVETATNERKTMNAHTFTVYASTVQAAVEYLNNPAE